VIGKTVNEVIPEPSLTMVLGKYRQAIEEGTVVRWEETSDYPAGRMTGEVSVAPVFDNAGTCTHLVGSVHDITEVKRAREIENQLASDLAASRDEIRALAARLLTVQEEERRNLSRELHDQVCQNLVGLAMQVAALATKPPPPKEAQTRLKAIQASMFKAAEEARDLAYQVHSPILDDLGLMIALEDLYRKFSEQHPDIPVDLENAGLPAAVPREVASCIFRVAQESLQNIAKHSNAKNVSVALGLENGAVVLTIGDDGVGFDLRAVKGRKGLGLIGMDERARLVKGKLTITAQPAHGTQITLEIPLHVGNS
jgi:signal transduction histidine kinase